MWHVLEHTYSPRKALESALRVLRPGGLLSLAVPNYGSAEAAIFRNAWSGCEVPRHLYFFNRSTLKRYLEEAGFKIVRLRTRTGATSVPRAFRHIANEVVKRSEVDRFYVRATRNLRLAVPILRRRRRVARARRAHRLAPVWIANGSRESETSRARTGTPR
jgi:predicted SAM-dependent methyltransferase